MISLIHLFFLLQIFFCSLTNGFKMSPTNFLSVTRNSNSLSMGLFDNLFGPKKSASASHILVSGPEGPQFLSDLKTKLNSAKNLPVAFSDAAVNELR